MAALAVVEAEIAAKRSLASVTGGAGLSACGDEVLSWARRAYLAGLRRACGHLVAISARQPLPRAVVGVTEGESVRARRSAGLTIGFLIVTDSARGNLTSRAGSTRRRVARVAVVMRREIRRN